MMSRFYQKNKDKILYSRPVLVVLLLVALFVGKAAWNSYVEMRETRLQTERSEEEFSALVLRSESLSYDIERLETPEGIEKEIRRRFSVAKEGEQVAVIIDSKNETQIEESVVKKGFFGSFFDKVKSIF